MSGQVLNEQKSVLFSNALLSQLNKSSLIIVTFCLSLSMAFALFHVVRLHRDNIFIKQQFILHELQERGFLSQAISEKTADILRRVTETALIDQKLSYIAFLTIDQDVLYYRNFAPIRGNQSIVAVKDSDFKLGFYEIFLVHDRYSSIMFEMPFHNADGKLVGSVRVGLPLADFYGELYYFMAWGVSVLILMLLTSCILSLSFNYRLSKGFGEISHWIKHYQYNKTIKPLAVSDVNLTEVQEIKSFMNHLLSCIEQEKLVLEQMVKSQTTDMENEMVQLKALLMTKTRFLANMSHEIRTPMNSILGLSKILLDRCEDADLLKHAQTIYFSSDYLLKLSNQILDFSKGEIHVNQEISEFSLHDLIRNVVELYSFEADKKNIKIEYCFSSTDIVIGDVTKIRQVLINILSNAIKFTMKGSVTLKTRLTSNEHDTKGNLMIICADTGQGIDKYYLPYIFNPFSQEKTSEQGAGLGLSITKRLVESMYGSIQVSSQKHKGTQFEINIPVRIRPREYSDESLNDDYFENIKDGKDCALPDIKDLNIMVVEDNEVNRFLIEEMLNKYGCQLHFFKEGKKAESAYRKFRFFDLILMDCYLPIRNGYEVAASIRQFEQKHGLKKVPIIALSADITHENRVRCMKSGMTGFLEKPMSQEKVYGVLKQYGQIAEQHKVTDMVSSSLCRLFLQEADSVFDQIEQAAKQGDKAVLKEKVHYFAASFLAIEERNASLLCSEIENNLNQADYPLAENISLLKTRLEDIKDKLEGFVSNS